MKLPLHTKPTPYQNHRHIQRYHPGILQPRCPPSQPQLVQPFRNAQAHFLVQTGGVGSKRPHLKLQNQCTFRSLWSMAHCDTHISSPKSKSTWPVPPCASMPTSPALEKDRCHGLHSVGGNQYTDGNPGPTDQVGPRDQQPELLCAETPLVPLNTRG